MLGHLQAATSTSAHIRVGDRPRFTQPRRPRITTKHGALPSFLPAEASEITEPLARQMLQQMRRIPVEVPCLDATIQTACVGPGPAALESTPGADSPPPVVLLHGFDSSGMEFRRLHPLLAEHTETWTVDLAGWGYTDWGMQEAPGRGLGPREKREHLAAFWRQHVGRPMVLVGASLGGAAVLDFAVHHPEAVAKVVLIDPQVLVDGIGPMASLPRFLAGLGVDLLRTPALRMAANKMAYFDKEQFATEDAMLVGRLHTHLPGWREGIVSFMLSGGYSVGGALAQVAEGKLPIGEVLVLWGRNDEILETGNAAKVVEALGGAAQLVWLEECGHVGHLEQPQRVAGAILEFAGVARQVAAAVVA